MSRAKVNSLSDLLNQTTITISDIQATIDLTNANDGKLDDHIAAVDPHPQYTTATEAANAAPVQSIVGRTGNVVLSTDDVTEGANLYFTNQRASDAAPIQTINGYTGNPVLNSADVGADPAGTASSEVTAHEGKADPHTQYYNQARGDLRYIQISNIGVDVASLDGGGKVPASQLPSFVDDVEEYANQGAFPATGETGKMYVALDTNKVYRWSGSAYIYITSGAVDSVNGQTGVVSLDSGDVGADPAGTAASEVSDHEGKPDPHPQYTTATEAANAAPVQSVNSQTGAVTLDTDDISEGLTNLYFTNQRASDAAPVQSVAGQTGAVTLDTDDVAEGLNLYYTDARASNAAPIQTVFGRSGDVVAVSGDYDASQIDFANAGTGLVATDTQAAIAEVDQNLDDHIADADPHPQYTTTAEAANAAPVQSVNSQTGNVTLDFDNYNGWELFVDSVSRGTVTTGEGVNFAAGTNLSLAYSASNNTITINADGGTDTNFYLDGLTFNTADGILTASVNGASNQTVDLDGRYLLSSDTASDSQLLDGLDSTQFLRSDVDDTFTGNLTVDGRIVDPLSATTFHEFTGSTTWRVVTNNSEALKATGSAVTITALNFQVNGNMDIAGSIRHQGDTNNAITFATDTQFFETNGANRMQISNTGVEVFDDLVVPDGTVGSNATRDVFISTAEPTAGDGADGDVWYVYS